MGGPCDQRPTSSSQKAIKLRVTACCNADTQRIAYMLTLIVGQYRGTVEGHIVLDQELSWESYGQLEGIATETSRGFEIREP